ncbi:MAG TPA: hypothetical protein PLV75_12295 [Saprospiraceae bacterium]|jgi:hypothetical protein|nr:hypothetical protein [Saprospiraceae bacterium]
MIKNNAGFIRGAGKGENPGSEYLHFQHIFHAIVQNPNLDLVKITSYVALTNIPVKVVYPSIT